MEEKKIKQKQIAVRPATYERLKKIKQGSFDQFINLLMDNMKTEEKMITVIKETPKKKEPSYPAACAAGSAVTTIGDTSTCSAFQTGSEESNCCC